ncbi:MAG: nucleoside deaminase [Candidatus Pacearchaeota archaeon]|jgi:tRNA(Arg) A34 adenosine deaminase TadA
MKEEEFMLEAINDAKKNNHHFGAVIIKDNKIISKAGKRPIGDARFHAESQAIIKATNILKNRNLRGCTLYTTCEPCPMCFYMAWITNVSKIIYGCSVKDAIKYKFKEINITDKELNHCGGDRIKIKGRFMREECLELFKN